MNVEGRCCNGIHASPLARVSSTAARSSSTVARSSSTVARNNPHTFVLFELEKKRRLET